jgi:FkbM family methyltransferase
MTSSHIQNFLQKSWPQRVDTMQFYVRQCLAKVPYIPVPVRLRVSPSQEIEFWWSQIVPYFDSKRGFFDYWGDDIGDLRFLWKVLQPGMVFMDIGAYQGIYSVVAGKKLNSAGRVFAFEPSPREFRRLRMHLRWNRMSTARSEMLALGSATSEATFFQVRSGDTTRNGLRPPDSRETLVEIPVNVTSLDEYVRGQNIERIDIIKLDVEGGEIEVIRGAKKVFGEFRPMLICEVLDETTHAWGYEAREIIQALRDYNYDWFDFNFNGSIEGHGEQQTYPRVKNYLAIPRERREEVMRWSAE